VSYAVIFPGQGAASPGAGEPWRSLPSWSVVTDAEIVVDQPLARLLLEADAVELGTTRASQLAVLLTSLVAWERFSQLVDEPPVAFAGHSLGQITALIAAGVVEREDGLRLAVRRAELSQRSADANPGRMAALMGADLDAAEKACTGVDAWLANDNAPGQIVIAGTPAGLDAAMAQARDVGVRRAIPLDVGHAFHTPLLDDAADALRPLLEDIAYRVPTTPVVTNTDAAVQRTADGWPERLARHLVEPVRWRDSQETLASLGVDTFVEIGPGRVLAGLARRTVPEVQVLNVATPDEAEAAATAVQAPTTSPPPQEATP
jgi:[acyl-carrier-protein] S-malonyltransferase